jgi:hypothetical protein
MKTDDSNKNNIENHIADILKIFPNQLVLSPKQLGMLRNKSEITLRRERKNAVGVAFIDRNGQIEYPIRAFAEWLNSTTKTA